MDWNFESAEQEYAGILPRVLAQIMDCLFACFTAVCVTGISPALGWDIRGSVFSLVQSLLNTLASIQGKGLLSNAPLTSFINYILSHQSQAVTVITSFVALFFYEAFFVASPAQATPGKLALGLSIASNEAPQLTLGEAILRQLMKFIFIAPLIAAFWVPQYVISLGANPQIVDLTYIALLGTSLLMATLDFPVAVLTHTHQAAHDLIAGSLVVREANPSRLRVLISAFCGLVLSILIALSAS